MFDGFDAMRFMPFVLAAAMVDTVVAMRAPLLPAVMFVVFVVVAVVCIGVPIVANCMPPLILSRPFAEC